MGKVLHFGARFVQPQFGVYAGDGVYLQRGAFQEKCGYLSHSAVSAGRAFGGHGGAALFERAEAVRACHAARAAGVKAWVVSHGAPRITLLAA